MLGCERPPPPEWLDENLVALSLRKAIGDQELVVESQEVGYACSPGTHYLSELFRVRANIKTGNGGTEQRALIVKCLFRSGPLREMVQEADMFLKETLLYTVMLPTAGAALKASEGSDWKPLAARCYHSDSQPTDFLVLEDLQEAGFTESPRGQLLDRHHCSLVLKALARLHAASLLVSDHQAFAAACFSHHPFSNKFSKIQFAAVIGKLFSALADILEEHAGYEKFAPKYRQSTERIMDQMATTFSSCCPQLKVLVHGDLWKNNTMFKFVDGCPVDVRLVDFQNCYWGSPAADIQHFLGTSASLEVHQQHVPSLLADYHRVLQDSLRALGFQQRADAFPLDQLRREVDHFAPHVLWVASIAVPMTLAPQPPAADAAETMKLLQSDGTHLKQLLNIPDFISLLKYILPVYESVGAK